MKIAIGVDHGAFMIKEELVAFMSALGHEVTDFGCHSCEAVDYPDVAIPLCEAVSRGEFDRGVLLCGTGIGMSIIANKVRGIRCAHVSDCYSARVTREHNESNVIAMGARVLGNELIKEILSVWLSADFIGKQHIPRLKKLKDYECK